jgi:hypothetical protein
MNDLLFFLMTNLGILFVVFFCEFLGFFADDIELQLLFNVQILILNQKEIMFIGVEAIALAKALKVNSSITNINLYFNNINSNGTKAQTDEVRK